MIRVIRAKLHGIRVTGADLNYHGSITLDPDHCKAAGIYPLEFVEVWNKSTAIRLTTYVIFGKAGSGCCIMNGAAARTCHPGDELIIAASEYIDAGTLTDMHPRVLTFTADNRIDQRLRYRVEDAADDFFDFHIDRE